MQASDWTGNKRRMSKFTYVLNWDFGCHSLNEVICLFRRHEITVLYGIGIKFPMVQGQKKNKTGYKVKLKKKMEIMLW